MNLQVINKQQKMEGRFTKGQMFQGKIEQQSEQGLGEIKIVNYPFTEDSLVRKMKKKPGINQPVYNLEKCFRVVQRQLEKLSDYDYDISYVCQRFDFDRSNANHRKYERFIAVCNQCACGNNSIDLYQRVTFYFEFVEQKNQQQEQKVGAQENIEGQYQKMYKKLKNQIYKQLHQILEHTLYPYLMKYYLVISRIECSVCKAQCEGLLYKNQIQSLSKLFCRNIAVILTQEGNPSKQLRNIVKRFNKK